ncbi:MAG: hypothetical protein K2I42_05750 [Anaeroplasmataceae bacterium]|nr:hypothetical protein [Anaeroplasmataceae bacterium]
MPNKIENNEIVKPTEKVYYNTENLEGEMMRYRNNSLSYKLGMLGILCSILGAFVGFNSLSWNFTIIFKILINIIILLFGFLSIEKVKAYSKTYSIVLIGIGVVCGLRILWAPLTLFVDYAAYLKDHTVTGSLGPTITGSYLNNSYLWMNGYVRATIMIVFLVLAAIAFICSGLIGIIRSKKYSDFIATQDTTKGV